VTGDAESAEIRLIKRAPRAAARVMFETVKQAIDECDPDERYEIVREIYDWTLTAGGEIADDFHVAYLVCLDGRIRGEEAQRTLGLLMAVRHVISVEPVDADDEYRVARVQERYRLHKLLMGALDDD
jgi:hypothetical protein